MAHRDSFDQLPVVQCILLNEAGESRFSDNWFTLYPGEERVIRADRKDHLGSLRVLCLSTSE